MDTEQSLSQNVDAEQAPSKATPESYYDSDNGFKYYSIINSIDYSGMGIWEELIEHEDPINRVMYKRGNGRSIRDATKARDHKVLKLIKEYMPSKKVKILELGSGRGGLCRYLARELIKEDKLELVVATNISDIENNYNIFKAKEENIPEDKYRVDYASFDDLQYDSESFDIIFSNEAILHSQDKAKLMSEVARILKKDGCCILSDILESPNADKDKLTAVYKRLDLNSMGNHELYEAKLTEAGMTKLVKEVSSESIIKHYGMVLYSATELKRDELLGPNGVTKEFLDKQIEGLHKWIQCGSDGLVEQGWFVFRK